jgi:hypothetical protein
VPSHVSRVSAHLTLMRKEDAVYISAGFLHLAQLLISFYIERIMSGLLIGSAGLTERR